MGQTEKNRVALVLIDGIGASTSQSGNAVSLANPNNYNRFLSRYPSTILDSKKVCDISGCVSNHSIISAGRRLLSPLKYINQSIKDNSFYDNKNIVDLMENCQRHSSSLHLVGDIDKNDINSSINHIEALLKMAGRFGLMRVYLHLFCDDDNSELDGVENVLEIIRENKVGEIATLIGSSFVRSNNFELSRVSRAIRAMVDGRGEYALDPRQASYYAKRKNIVAKKMTPVVIVESGEAIGTIRDFDSVLFFNVSPNSIDQLANLFSSGFPKKIKTISPRSLRMATMTSYNGQDSKIVKTCFKHNDMSPNMIEIVSASGLKQIHIAESENSETVTYQMSNSHTPLKGESWDIISSNVSEYIKKPVDEMCKSITNALSDDQYDLIVSNFYVVIDALKMRSIKEVANAILDMDQCLGEIERMAIKNDVKLVITSSNGGAENVNMGLNASANVPIIFVSNKLKDKKKINMGMSLTDMLNPENSILDLAPTIIDLLGIKVPDSFFGRSLASNFEE